MTVPKSPRPKQPPIKAIGKYSGMAFQLFGACLAGVFIGRWLDNYLQLERPTWAVFLTIFFMLGSLYTLYRQLLRD